MVIGYTTGVYDLFHIGHLNLLKNARGMCDKLIVGVTVDDMDFFPGMHHENIKPVPEDQRIPVHTAEDIDREMGKQMEQFLNLYQ